MVITNKVGNTCDKIYRNVLQNWPSWDKKVVKQGKSELLTRFHCPSIQRKRKTCRTDDKDIRKDNGVS